MRMVAIGFDEFASLQQIVNKILRDLSRLSVDVKTPQIVFSWSQDGAKAGVNSGSGTNVQKVYSSNVPVGTSANQWTTTVYREVENHLLSGSKFSIGELMGGNLTDPYFILPLERI